MTVELLSFQDIILVPIYLAILLWITHMWSKKYENTHLKKYILFAFLIRILGCFFLTFYLQYIYKGGDSFIYFDTVVHLKQIFKKNPIDALFIIFTPIDSFTVYQKQLLTFNSASVSFLYESNAVPCRIGSLLNLICFDSYLCISLLITYCSFIGSWLLFLTFRDIYPMLEDKIAIATLFIPSVCFWGSGGLIKEAFLIATMGCLFYSFYIVLIKKQINYYLILLFLLSFLIIAIVRVFIAMLIIPLLFFWLFIQYQGFIKNTYVKISSLFLVLSLSIYSVNLVSKNSRKFNIQGIINSAIIYQKNNQTENSANYDLGKVEYSFQSMVKIIPYAIFTGMCRPNFWDLRRWVLLPVVIENFVILLMMLYALKCIITKGLKKSFNVLLEPALFFCLVLTLSIFFISGFTASNFGNLVRYRVSALPFFLILIFVVCFDKRKNIVKKTMFSTL
jgi:hypothetical protein